MALKLFSTTDTVERSVLKTTSFFLAITGAGFTIVNFFIWDVPKFGYIDFAYTLLCLFIYLRIQFGHYKPWYSALLICGLSLILIYSLAVAKGYSILVFWTFCMPPVFHILLNRYVGSAVTFAFFLIVVSIFLSYPPINHSTGHTTFNFAIPYILIWAIAFVHEDVRAKTQQKLSNAALLDPLTGARNRLCMENDFSHHSEFLSHHYLLHIDLDHFKQVNDNYGHACGDEVLKSVSKAVLSLPNVEYLYRVGGEEFCVLLCAKNEEQAMEMSESIRLAIKELKIDFNHQEIRVSFSAGLRALIVVDDSILLDQTMAETDQALYRAKAQGRDQIVLSSTTNQISAVG
ncbi:GGDEF domain-containing protein [Vibrio europaeus]|uniref:diguanylate cyclase n=1 Tax=Vibrio europaeus TaxID=300876 RepID=A0AAE7DWN9_9VIBR|nr:GGDEF domain-containing protein [Vibrio europaeus]MDC5807155.1 GGDEF domain-containing protein [Vibrio europaeus]MDC5809750.1 GGDEF domain-containing protein [Vibrio europaeus]MDC5827680.1 GGDEF domain-containing protein [Vibrio europaeus]MDC5830524.1 GGDEF domain-containing protein [Vibrio europaeus]MDC5837380.1 GGDEF domain-containing protein [Vibrio europaeus]